MVSSPVTSNCRRFRRSRRDRAAFLFALRESVAHAGERLSVPAEKSEGVVGVTMRALLSLSAR